MKNFYSKEDIYNLKSYDIREVAYKLGLLKDINDDNGFCPIHERNGEHNPSLTFNNYGAYRNTCTCWRCSKKIGDKLVPINWDSISLVQVSFGINFKEACSKLEEIIDDNFKQVELASTKKEEVETNENTKEEVLSEFDINYKNSRDIHELHDRNEHYLDNFFNARSVLFKKCEDVLKTHFLEFRHQFKKIKDKDGNVKEIQNYIIFFDKHRKFAIKRRIDDICFGVNVDHNDRYRNVGSVQPTFIRGNKDNIIIFESLYDLLCLYSHTKNPRDYTWVSLNSTNNVSKLKDKSNIFLRAKNIYTLVDNDEAGDDCIKYIKNNFNKVNDIRHLLGDYNDVCDAIKHKHYIRLEDINNGKQV